jgi:antitoxin CptB
MTNGDNPTEDEVALKRLRMRSWRRGMKEMDLILGPFADQELPSLGYDGRAIYEEMLSENDQDLYAWITGAEPEPSKWSSILQRLRVFHGIR